MEKEINQIIEKENQVVKNNSGLKNFIRLFIAVIVASVVVGLIAGGLGWYVDSFSEAKTKKALSEKEVEDSWANQFKSEREKIANKIEIEEKQDTEVYENKEFGFSLEIPDSWDGFEARQILLGGDFNLAEVNFYLPTAEAPSDSQIPGYLDIFTISIFVKDSWYENERDKTNDGMWGEIIGENELYIFLYSHLNGDVPQDISTQAIRDMDEIAEGIETFEADPQESTVDDSYLNVEAFKDESIYYWNCMYRYGLYYPVNWSNNSPDNISEEAKFFGDDIMLSVKVHEFEGSLDEFTDSIVSKKGGEIVDSRDKERYGTRIIAYEISDPDSVVIVWQEEDVFMEFNLSGKGMKENSYIIDNIVTTFIFNQYFEECVN